MTPNVKQRSKNIVDVLPLIRGVDDNEGLIMLPYESTQDGYVYMDWVKLADYIAQYELAYPHNRGHRRVRLFLIKPAVNLLSLDMSFVPAGSANPYDWKTYSDDWSVIFEPFHYHAHDPTPSWMMFVEKGHKKPTWGEPIELFSTGPVLFMENHNHMARFRGLYYIVSAVCDLGFGIVAPPYADLKRTFRSVDDDWEEWN